MEYLDPQGTGLVDHLVSSSVLTESDEESLASSSTRRDKTRKLLSIVSSSSAEKIERGFLPALDATHPQQARSLRKKMKEVRERPPTPTCISCKIRNEVDLSRIASLMYKNKHINKALYEDLCNVSISHQKKWAMVLESDLRQKAAIDALSYKYTEFYEQCQKLGIQNLECLCPVLSSNLERKTSTPGIQEDDTYIPTFTDKKASRNRCISMSSSVANKSDFSSLRSYRETWINEDFLACSTKRHRIRPFGKKDSSERISRYLEYGTSEFTPQTLEYISTDSTESSDYKRKPLPVTTTPERKTSDKERKTRKTMDVVWV